MRENIIYSSITFNIEILFKEITCIIVLGFGLSSHVGRDEILYYPEPLPHDISSLTMYGLTDDIQYEVRNHESKFFMKFIELPVNISSFLTSYPMDYSSLYSKTIPFYFQRNIG